MEESSVTKLNKIEVVQIISPKKLVSLYFDHKIFLLKHKQILRTWLQQPAFLQVECSSSFYCYDAEDSPSIGDATRRKMKLTFENNLKTCLCHLVVPQIMFSKRHRIFPFLDLLDEPHATCYVYTYDDGKEQSKNWITVLCRSLCMHDCLVTTFLVVWLAG